MAASKAFGLLCLLACLAGLAAAGAAARGEGESRVIASIADGGPNETRATLPITRTQDGAPYVVLSQRLRAGGGLQRGDVVRATAELQLSTTCVLAEPRCIGSRYGYSPRMRAQIVLASSPTATGGAAADPVSSVEQRTCNQQRPNRNHHCVLAFRGASKTVKNAGDLPCRPDDCFLNVVASAYHPNAGFGDVVVVGADRPDGTVAGDKGRVDGLVLRNVPRPRIEAGGAKIAARIPIAPDGRAGRRVARSVRVDGLRKGDALSIGALQSFRISSVPYNVFIGSRVIVATSPKEIRTNGFVTDAISNGGAITEQNGYNCTHGQSAYEDPCTSEKAATAYVRKDLPRRNGEPKPVFVNFVAAALPKLASARPGDRMRVGKGQIRVLRYRAAP